VVISVKEYYGNSIIKYENIRMFNAIIIIRYPRFVIVLPEINISVTNAQ
jgi:hypothetical protein